MYLSYKKCLCAIFLFLPHFLSGVCLTGEMRVGRFYPSTSIRNRTYTHGGLEYELEGSLRLSSFSFWANINSFKKKGEFFASKKDTTLKLYPLSLGVKYDFQLFQFFAFYLGLGTSYSWVSTSTKPPFVKQHTKESGWGAIGKSGLIIYLLKGYFLDLYADYYYTKVSSELGNLNVSGLRTGCGLGLNF